VTDDVGQAINITNYYLMEGDVRRDAPELVSGRRRSSAISRLAT